MKHLGDITKINGAEIEPVDVITGGSPCQDLSVAGKRAGLAGARSGLFMEQIRIVKEMREHERRMGRTGEFVRPRYMVWENVPGAFSSNGGRDFAAVLEEIIRIAEPEAPDIEVPEKGWPTWGGYHDEVGGRWSVAWRVHDAQHWGVPQRRRRISIVADFGGDTAGEISFERKSVRRDIATSGTAGEEAGGGTGAGADCAIPINDKATRYAGGGNSRNNDGSGNGLGVGRDGDPSPTITAADRHIVAAGMSGNNQPMVCHKGAKRFEYTEEQEEEADERLLKQMTAEDAVCAGFKLGNSEKSRGIGYAEECAPTLNAECGGNKPAVMAFDTTQITSPENRSRLEFGNPCHTLNASAHTPCVAFDMTHACDVIRECGEHAPSKTARAGTGGNQVPLTYQMQGFGDYREGDVASSCKQRDFKDSTDLVCSAVDCRNFTESGEINGTLQAKESGGQSLNLQNTVRQNMVVRRLTPLECERLQGYPDRWTDIGEWRDSKGKLHKDADSPRYKACGNSIALPFWQFLAKRISAQYIRPITMGSLFDGISGFCLCFAKWNGANSCRWASEIEEFPIAVAKKHFGDEETGEVGDFERILFKKI